MKKRNMVILDSFQCCLGAGGKVGEAGKAGDGASSSAQDVAAATAWGSLGSAPISSPAGMFFLSRLLGVPESPWIHDVAAGRLS